MFPRNRSFILNFHNEGYYTVETTDYPDTGLPVLVTDAYFPYFNSYRTLTSPLIYVSTPDEYKALQTSENTRDEFETYVRNAISSNSQVARDFIKHYYRRIRKSARLFSEDKEGWKTDRGMIYQVFGNPSEVFRNEKTELWVYPSSTNGKIRFIFHIEAEGGSVKSKLVRNKRHKKAWMQAVMQWRSGRTTD